MKLRYLRVFLRTFAIGLAAVWIVAGLKMASHDVSVKLPKASEDLLYVYPETDTFTSCCQGGGAGGGSGSGNDWLDRIKPKAKGKHPRP